MVSGVKNLKFFIFYFKHFSGHMENFDNMFEDTETDPGKLAVAFYSGIFSYAGWYENFNFT